MFRVNAEPIIICYTELIGFKTLAEICSDIIENLPGFYKLTNAVQLSLLRVTHKGRLWVAILLIILGYVSSLISIIKTPAL